MSLSKQKKIQMRINIRKRLKNYYAIKNRTAKLIAYQYDIYMTQVSQNVVSNIPNDAFGSANSRDQMLSVNGMEVKINVDINLFCNSSTNYIRLSTREFSIIDLK